MKIIFKILDYTISVLMGAGTVCVVSLLIGMEWNMFLAMFVGMILGMVVLVLIVLIFSPVSTPFELFPVGMIITMVTGMLTGMVCTRGEAGFTVILVAAVLFSLSAQFVMDIYNMRLRGEVPIDR